VKRFLVMTEPPSIDKGEITDKGYVNQRQTQDCRADLVASLYADTAGPMVVQL
jgi:feruloyl-CoA synthase